MKRLKPEQILFRLFYLIKNAFLTRRHRKSQPLPGINLLELDESPVTQGISFSSLTNSFTFLNISHSFGAEIDWNYARHGKLWTYNLNYFEFLSVASREDGLKLIRHFISREAVIRDGFEPYPISLRGIAWIKFLSKHKIEDEQINNFLFKDYCWLSKNLEYHLLGNHLLENAFSLFIASFYFQHPAFHHKAVKLLLEQLDEQVIPDGGHFELSPMYHCILLHRLLDCICIVKHHPKPDTDKYQDILIDTASRMLGWLASITFKNGDVPNLNDSALLVGPGTKDLQRYASLLAIEQKQSQLKESGYRKWSIGSAEIVFDVGHIGPTYQPGHAHADTFSFCISKDNQNIIVDPGISTYEANDVRCWERSTNAHNTIEIDSTSSSEVWASFRVGSRAEIGILHESEEQIAATHNGYEKLGYTIKRCFKREKEELIIIDEIQAKQDKNGKILGHLHFAPDLDVRLSENKLLVQDHLQIVFLGDVVLALEEYHYPCGFNRTARAQRLVYRLNAFTASLQFQFFQ